MARTLVIDSIEAAGRSFSSGEELLIDPQLQKFVVNFRRSANYVGDYGFDWLREEYIHPIVEVKTDHDGNPHTGALELCDDVKALKKEYKTTDVINAISPYGSDYYPAWLAMYPDTPEANASHGSAVQSYGVYLSIEIEELEPLSADPTELIFEPSTPNLEVLLKTPKLLLKDLISSTPKEIKWNKIVQKKLHGTANILRVKCNGNLDKNEEIKVFAKLRNQKVEVGKLMVYKNSNYKDLQFDITPVRILRTNSKTADMTTIEGQIDSGFGDVTKPIADDLKSLETYLNTLSLNQALLNAKVGTVYDVEIDEAKWISDGLIIGTTKVFIGDNVLEKFFEEFKKQHPRQANKNGLIAFLAPISNDSAGGEGDLYDIDAKHFVIYQTNLHHQESYAHEIGHVLGLRHPFDKYSQSTINQYNNFVTQVDTFFNSLIAAGTSEIEIANYWKNYKDDYAIARGYLQTYYHYFRNQGTFKQATTENIMDYSSEKDAHGLIIQTNKFSRASFWKHQWKVMQSEITNYYSK